MMARPCLSSQFAIKHLNISHLLRPWTSVAAAAPGLTVPRMQLSASSVDRGSLKNITIAADLKQLPRGPAPALGLGLAGLIPFVSAPVYMYNAGFFLPAVAAAQLAYAATILSFLGGVRWGALVTAAPGDPDLPPSWAQFSWSVAPSLVAWGALLVPSVAAGQLVCGAGLVAAAAVDLQQRSFPAWFRGLRFLLTFFAVLSLLASTVCSYTLGSLFPQHSDYLS